MANKKPKIRLYVNEPFVKGGEVSLSVGQSHYLAHVMRCREGDVIAIFNGHDGVWRADITVISKKQVTLTVIEQQQAQQTGPDIWLMFAPIKGKSERVVEKATELGASHIVPVFMQHSVVRSVNMDKLMANVIEAAEQSERHDVPTISAAKHMVELLANWPEDRWLLYADESGSGDSLKALLSPLDHMPCAILIGPEGGFSNEEKHMLQQHNKVKPFGMGPRILKADTAAIAALACVQAWVGDWDKKPRFEAVS